MLIKEESLKSKKDGWPARELFFRFHSVRKLDPNCVCVNQIWATTHIQNPLSFNKNVKHRACICVNQFQKDSS